ncbi:MAG: hypothetical protein ACLGI6_07495, partial [Gammaproteobacteria bacterium]
VLARSKHDVAPGDFRGAAGAFSVFVVDRARTSGVHAKPRWRTLPAPAADIAGVRFDAAAVDEDQLTDATERLLEDVLDSLNATQLSQQRFREVARIAGLVFQGYPGQPKSTRQVQASSSLFFEVFRKHDSGNLLLTQAQREVMEQELELTRLRDTLKELHARALAYKEVPRATPFGFALMVERFREKLTTEKLSDRITRMLRELEKAATP